jgi:hypothetical protein
MMTDAERTARIGDLTQIQTAYLLHYISSRWPSVLSGAIAELDRHLARRAAVAARQAARPRPPCGECAAVYPGHQEWCSRCTAPVGTGGAR